MRKLMAPPRDRDIELGLDLSQIGVERARYRLASSALSGVGSKPQNLLRDRRPFCPDPYPLMRFIGAFSASVSVSDASA